MGRHIGLPLRHHHHHHNDRRTGWLCDGKKSMTSNEYIPKTAEWYFKNNPRQHQGNMDDTK
jgi:hypothetical protein